MDEKRAAGQRHVVPDSDLVDFAGDGGGGVAKRWADLVDVELEHGAPGAVGAVEAALPKPAHGDDVSAAAQGLGGVLGQGTPRGAAHKQRVPSVHVPVVRS